MHVSSFGEEKTYETTTTTTNYGDEISAIIGFHKFCKTLQDYIGTTMQYRSVFMFIK